MKFDLKFLAIALLLSASVAASAREPKLPVVSGTYAFQHRYAEQPEIPGLPLIAKIRGHRIELVNETEDSVWPKGVLVEGTLMWHAASGKWIIGHSASDRNAPSVGGCSDGPEVIDLIKRIYWTC